MNVPKVAVVGTGTIGSQVLWRLAHRGVPAVGYELFSPGHPRGAAGGESRLFRFVELEDMRYLPVVHRADALWNDLQATSASRLRVLDGALTIVEEGSDASRNALDSAALLGDGTQVLSREDTIGLFPDFRIGSREFVVVDHRAGTIFPERAIQAAAAAAVARGVTIRTESRVIELVQRGSQVVVRTDDHDDVYDRVVVAVGAWTSTLLPEMAPLLAPRRLLSTWYAPRMGHSLAQALPFIRAAPHYSYGLPTPDGSSMKIGLGFAHHEVIESPDTADLRVTESDLAAVRGLVDELLPNLDSYPIRMNPYFESYTRSRIEYIGPHPSMDAVTVLAGFSGKGFKTSPAIGELGAQLATGSDVEPEFRFLVDAEHVPW